MSEAFAGHSVLTLREVALEIQRSVQVHHAEPVWVKAEMNKLNLYPHSGHCYPELVEKQDGRVVAQMRANLWREDYNRVNSTFLEVLREPLKDGIMILFLARVTFDPVYGLALRILDIDPAFSLGELEREKQAAIAALKKEGVLDRNKQVSFPLLPRRIAVISVETSKGLADFYQVIGQNPWGYRFFTMLFPALLQGDQAAGQIIAQLRRIRKAARHFDVVAIIRGGGDDVGLSCYNDLGLAREIALFPLPVLTGIGHSTNETVAERVAFHNAITPTGLADFLLLRFHDFAVPVKEAGKIIARAGAHLLSSCRIELDALQKMLKTAAGRRLLLESKELDRFDAMLRLTDPEQVLKRGYSITFRNGKPLTGADQAEKGDEIETRLYRGTLKSIIK